MFGHRSTVTPRLVVTETSIPSGRQELANIIGTRPASVSASALRRDVAPHHGEARTAELGQGVALAQAGGQAVRHRHE